jgi:hypothetical protein
VQPQPVQPQPDERTAFDTVVDPPPGTPGLQPPPPPPSPPASPPAGQGEAAPPPAKTGELPFSMPAAQPDAGATAETLMSSVPEGMARAAERDEGEDLDNYLNQVFKDFVTVKRQCGESTANLTFERFRKKLIKNRKLLMDRYSCRSVKFQVYIKDGKAALKATPVKD